MSDFNTSSICGCQPPQVVNFKNAFSDASGLAIYNNCKQLYGASEVQWAYSLDGVTWTCFMNCEEFLKATTSLGTDFFVRARVEGPIGNIDDYGEPVTDYSTSLEPGFKFGTVDPSQISNLYNPYANTDGAVALAQQLTESVSSMFGIQIYYFKLSPNVGSKDITFKEYALMDVEAVKQIQMIIADGKMPSSRPVFSEFGFDWDTDWQTEISKSSFATAFGPNAQPMEGDLIYVPMMKRMWMVNEAYEEKAESLMWVATTFTLQLTKYQEKDSVDLGDTEDLVNSFVKNKYDDLFGDEEPLDSGIEANSVPSYKSSNLYPVYESDATRKFIAHQYTDAVTHKTYYDGAIISDMIYRFLGDYKDASIVYQRGYCGTDGTLSFIIIPLQTQSEEDNLVISVANIQVRLKQSKTSAELYLLNNEATRLTLNIGKTHFITLRWSAELNVIEMYSAPYIYPEEIPLYKLQPYHYKFDMDNKSTVVSRYNIEMLQEEKGDVVLHGFAGKITNIKLFDVFNDNDSEILHMLPNHQHLLINDTARNIIELGGVKL